MQFGTYLVRNGIISANQFVEAEELRQESRLPIGELALHLGKLPLSQFNQVVRHQARTCLSFGESVMQLGYLGERDLADLLKLQADRAKKLDDILIESGAVSRGEIIAARQKFYNESPIAMAIGSNSLANPSAHNALAIPGVR